MFQIYFLRNERNFFRKCINLCSYRNLLQWKLLFIIFDRRKARQLYKSLTSFCCIVFFFFVFDDLFYIRNIFTFKKKNRISFFLSKTFSNQIPIKLKILLSMCPADKLLEVHCVYTHSHTHIYASLSWQTCVGCKRVTSIIQMMLFISSLLWETYLAKCKYYSAWKYVKESNRTVIMF